MEKDLPGITDIIWKGKEMHKIMAVPLYYGGPIVIVTIPHRAIVRANRAIGGRCRCHYVTITLASMRS